MKIKQINEEKVDEIILESEEAGKKEKIRLAENVVLGEPAKGVGDKISLILVGALFLLSIIQSVELFNLRSQIVKGQFTSGAAASPASGAGQGLPAQQGGC